MWKERTTGLGAEVVGYFENDAKVQAFERYLKGGSGHSFAQRHFW